MIVSQVRRTPLPGDFGLTVISEPYVNAAIRVGEALNGDGFGSWQTSPDKSRHFRGFSHAFCLLDNGEILEAEPGGAVIRPNPYTDSATVYSQWDLTDDQRADADQMGRTLIGVPYSAADYFALAAHRLHLPVPGLRRYVASSGHMICSQMVDWWYQLIGLQMFGDGRWPGYVTPEALTAVLAGPKET